MDDLCLAVGHVAGTKGLGTGSHLCGNCFDNGVSLVRVIVNASHGGQLRATFVLSWSGGDSVSAFSLLIGIYLCVRVDGRRGLADHFVIS